MSFIKTFTIALVIGAVVGSTAFFVKRAFKPSAEQTAKSACISEALSSNTKRETAVAVMATHLYQTDKAHLIKHINTTEAVSIVYCSK